VIIDGKDSSKCIATLRFHRLKNHLKIFYDPWFRFIDNREGRFDVVSKIHPVPIPVNFGKGWPVSVKDPVVDAIDGARRTIYPYPAGDLIYQVHIDGKEIMTFNGKEAKGGHPNVMYLLDRADFWQDGKVLRVTISEADLVDLEKVAFDEEDPALDDDAAIRAPGLKTKVKSGKTAFQAYTGEVITFEASKQGCESYEWDFGDGRNANFLKSHRVTHKFEEAGSFAVELTFVSENTTKTITAGIDVNDRNCTKVTKYGTKVVGYLAVAFAVIEYLGIDISV